MTDKTVTITDNQTGASVDCPVLTGTHGADVIDINPLYPALNMFVHDPGFGSTSSCESSITFIDGEKGILLYRGYPIEQLAEHSNWLEVCYLLLYGDLPDKEQLQNFSNDICDHSMLHEELRRFYGGYKHNAHPMAMLVGVVGALSGYYHEDLDVYNAEHRDLSAIRLIAKMPTIAANAYKYIIGQPYIYPDNTLGYVENFLRMMFAVPCENYNVAPKAARALELMFILHADHEQNASTSTVRLAGSSGANPFACVAGGVATLWGPAHGGANEAVINMLEQIKSPEDIPAFIERAKDKNDPFRLMGFGHRVYKNHDPRATIIRKACHELLDDLDANQQPLFKVALELEKIALEDEYFIERKLYPNVDFYSGIIMSALGIPLNMFTVIFSMARTVGWVSHWKEMMDGASLRIGRPRQLYSGSIKRDFVPMEER